MKCTDNKQLTPIANNTPQSSGSKYELEHVRKLSTICLGWPWTSCFFQIVPPHLKKAGTANVNHVQLGLTLFLNYLILWVETLRYCQTKYLWKILLIQGWWHLSKVLFCDCLTLSASTLAPETFRPEWGPVLGREAVSAAAWMFHSSLCSSSSAVSLRQYFQRIELDIGEAWTVCSETVSSRFFYWVFLHVLETALSHPVSQRNGSSSKLCCTNLRACSDLPTMQRAKASHM